MLQTRFLRLVLCVIVVSFPGACRAQDKPAQQTARTPATQTLPDLLSSLTPLKNAATDEQIREYLYWSRAVDDYRTAWIAGVDNNRSHSKPYWPETFWADIKTEMQNTDLVPMFVIWYRHTISRQLMDKVLDAYHKLGRDHFPGSPMCTEMGNAESPMKAQWDQLTVLMTRQVIAKVYTADKPQIDAARARYLAEHPGWKDQ
jgi:hypothetical protein